MVNGPEDFPRVDLDSADWDSIVWAGPAREVERLRQRIFKAAKEEDWPKVRNLQKLMLRSRSNTLVSVRQVTQRNAGRMTAGIDEEVALTSSARADVAVRVHQSIRSWQPLAVKRVYIPKSGSSKKKLRPLGIPVIMDRCHQNRAKNALEPGLDRWHVTASRTTAKMTSGFFGFAMTEGFLPRLKLPAHPAPGPATQPISEQQRLALIRRALTDSTGPVRTRAAGLLILLFAQPASRITRLTADDITANGTGATFLRLGDPPICVPEPFAPLIRQAAAEHPAAVISPAGRWLFPGQNAGRPLHPATLSHLLTQYGIPVPAARTAAFRALVQQAPAPVIAQALGYSGTAATTHAAAAGDTWSRYAAGDHTR